MVPNHLILVVVYHFLPRSMTRRSYIPIYGYILLTILRHIWNKLDTDTAEMGGNPVKSHLFSCRTFFSRLMASYFTFNTFREVMTNHISFLYIITTRWSTFFDPSHSPFVGWCVSPTRVSIRSMRLVPFAQCFSFYVTSWGDGTKIYSSRYTNVWCPYRRTSCTNRTINRVSHSDDRPHPKGSTTQL